MMGLITGKVPTKMNCHCHSQVLSSKSQFTKYILYLGLRGKQREKL